ncbi:MAG: 3-deoxy-7-phosphoheptulonate synthase, partial [Anaerolineae bacterium]
MIIVMRPAASEAEIRTVIGRVERMGYKVHLSQGEARTV